jgi:DNA-binding response OmpR family regulator
MVVGISSNDGLQPVTLVNEMNPTLNRLAILVAEDSWHVAIALKALLENEGATVIGPASTIQEARSMVQTEQVDAAVIDFNLHGQSADPLIADLRARGIKTVVITGYECVSQLDLKAVTVLKKPVHPKALLKALKSADTAGRPST